MLVKNVAEGCRLPHAADPAGAAFRIRRTLRGPPSADINWIRHTNLFGQILMAVQPGSKKNSCPVCPAFLYCHNVSKFLTPLQAVPRKVRPRYTSYNFSLVQQAELSVSQPDADVKNSDTLWRYRKNFKFLKEVKILSEFLHSKLACLMPIYVSGGRVPEVSACRWM